jgi:hypothetical protein
MTREIGRRIATELTGNELFAFEHGLERLITARDLKSYVGGDTAVPAIRCEAGANARRISDFPNAQTAMGAADRITGLQNGENVNFTPAQIVAPLVDAMTALLVRCENIERLLQQREPKE